MQSLKKDYLIIVVDTEEDEVIGLFVAPEEKFFQLNQVQLPETEKTVEPGPDLYYQEDREHLRELRRKAKEREQKKRIQERMLRWMMEK